MFETLPSRRQRRSSTPQRTAAADPARHAICAGCGHGSGVRPRLGLRALGTLHLYHARSTCHADVGDYLPWLLECPCHESFHRATAAS